MRVLEPFFLLSNHGVGRLFTSKVSVFISGQTRFALKITLKVRCPKFVTHQVTMGSIVPIFSTHRLSGTFL